MDAEAVLAAFAGFEAAREALAGLSVESLTAAQTLTVLQMRERGHRRDLAIDHALTARLIDQADPHELGATSIKKLLTERLRITDIEAGDRLTDARQLGPKYTLTGERLQPDLPHTADALSRGVIGKAHVRIIQDFVKRLPAWVSYTRRDDYEHDLVGHAQTLVPEDFRKVAETLLAHIDQDGAEPDYRTQQRRRTVTVGRQQADGMSRLDGWIDPELRAFLDVVLAKHAAPGANLPHDDTRTGATPAPPANATTTPSKPSSATPWPPIGWARSPACPPPSSPAPPSANSNAPPDGPTPAAATASPSAT